MARQPRRIQRHPQGAPAAYHRSMHTRPFHRAPPSRRHQRTPGAPHLVAAIIPEPRHLQPHELVRVAGHLIHQLAHVAARGARLTLRNLRGSWCEEMMAVVVITTQRAGALERATPEAARAGPSQLPVPLAHWPPVCRPPHPPGPPPASASSWPAGSPRPCPPCCPRPCCPPRCCPPLGAAAVPPHPAGPAPAPAAHPMHARRWVAIMGRVALPRVPAKPALRPGMRVASHRQARRATARCCSRAPCSRPCCHTAGTAARGRGAGRRAGSRTPGPLHCAHWCSRCLAPQHHQPRRPHHCPHHRRQQHRSPAALGWVPPGLGAPAEAGPHRAPRAFVRAPARAGHAENALLVTSSRRAPRQAGRARQRTRWGAPATSSARLRPVMCSTASARSRR